MPISSPVAPAGGLLGVEDAAEFLACSPRMVRELWARRELPGVRVGRLVRFSRCDLEAYIAARRVPAARGALAPARRGR